MNGNKDIVLLKILISYDKYAVFYLINFVKSFYFIFIVLKFFSDQIICCISSSKNIQKDLFKI